MLCMRKDHEAPVGVLAVLTGFTVSPGVLGQLWTRMGMCNDEIIPMIIQSLSCLILPMEHYNF